MTERRVINLPQIDEAALTGFARTLAPVVADGGSIHLAGELGAGKTTFARALLGALGVGVRIKSPTYSLIESYAAGGLAIHHLDLYRIAAAEEVEWLGLRDLSVGRHLWLIEWPERAAAALPAPDLVVNLSHAASARDVGIQTVSARGRRWIELLG
ncbi:MAG: tRNA (adenosine(37)-N6)-threonylcarbamoyltransferase complex ATPase subunit type 1 TsaE [Rudaea sp.]|nr:tRNA (adenosine(37)-N6)-threonylcarbamoyltransferase complex ATPase subunit type 1 TsaE [Rudaea sp.]